MQTRRSRLLAALFAVAAFALAGALTSSASAAGGPSASATSAARGAGASSVHRKAFHRVRCVKHRSARRRGSKRRLPPLCKRAHKRKPALPSPAAKGIAAAGSLLAALLPALEEVAEVLGGGGGSTPPPPTASFVYSPAAPVTGRPVSFDATASTCAAAPCSYTWDDDGGPVQHGPGFALGSGQRLSFTFNEAGSKYVRLTVADARGRTATVEHTLTVSPPEEAPGKLVNTSPPTISGTLMAGETLTASPGTWTGAPSSFAYHWQRCSQSGESCASIGGATGSSYVTSAADIGHALRLLVIAKNATESERALSQPTAAVGGAEEEPGGGSGSCFANPESCGYPGTADTGANCSSLTPSGSVTASTPGQKVENLNITGTLLVNAPRVTIKNVCVTADGGGRLGSWAVYLANGATGTTISEATIRGLNESNHSVDEAISNNYGNAGATATKVQLTNCGECIHQTWTVTKSYVDANGMKGTSDHFEDWYFNDATVVAGEDTMFNPEEQTAVMFGDTGLGSGGPCQNHVTMTGSLIGGGGALFYPCGNASSVGSSAMTIKNNRFARCLGAHQYEPESGGTLCSGGADGHGFFPFGGFFLVAADFYKGAGQVWEGNVWDDDGKPVEP